MDKRTWICGTAVVVELYFMRRSHDKRTWICGTAVVVELLLHEKKS